MCRVANGLGLKLNHLGWSADSLQAYFCQTKTNQTGSKARDPKHIYANPFMPHICPMLALGVYLLSIELPQESERAPLFPGGSQYDRYTKILEKLYRENDIEIELENHGITSEDLGTHSCRKGASTYCSTGVLGGPHPATIDLRAGWSNGLKDRYIKYEIAGDQYLGRVVSGLPVCHAEFATLPPYFKDENNLVGPIVSQCFPNLPTRLRRVAEMSLASVVYHVRENPQLFARNHFIFFTPLFSCGFYLQLKDLVKCHLPTKDDRINATGLPEHVRVQLRLNEIEAKLDNIGARAAAVPEETTQRVTQVLEDRAIGAGTFTFNGLEQLLSRVVQQQNAPIERLLDRFTNNTPSNHAQLAQREPSALDGLAESASLPADFQFPICPPMQAWQLWCCGNATLGITAFTLGLRPFRTLIPDELRTDALKRQLTELRFMMRRIEEAVKRQGTYTVNPTLEEANRMYEIGKSAIAIPDQTATDRQRRKPQLSWTYVVQIVRRQFPSARGRGRRRRGFLN